MKPAGPPRRGQGAVAVRTEKGLKVERVAVKRYQAGQRPRYAQQESDSDDDDDVFVDRDDVEPEEAPDPAESDTAAGVTHGDARLARLHARTQSGDVDARKRRRRRDDDEADEAGVEAKEDAAVVKRARQEAVQNDDDESDDEGAAERRRARMRARAKEREADSEVAPESTLDALTGGASLVGIGAAAASSSGGVGGVTAAAEGSDEEESGSSEYETDTEDDETDNFKPVFVRKGDRVSVKEKEAAAAAEKKSEQKKKVREEQRAKQSSNIAAESVKRVIDEENPDSSDEDLTDSDGNNEEDHEAWKVRELKRLKRTRDEREAREAEKAKIERRKNMTIEEVEADIAKEGGKEVTNQRQTGKMKFMQKYYHRGAFFMDQDEDVYKRDTTAATGEDQFNKAVLPKVMQVKNFGRMGRTKYTHLLDQDTSIMRSKGTDGSDVYGAVDPFMRADTDQKKKLSQDAAFKRPSASRRKQ